MEANPYPRLAWFYLACGLGGALFWAWQISVTRDGQWTGQDVWRWVGVTAFVLMFSSALGIVVRARRHRGDPEPESFDIHGD